MTELGETQFIEPATPYAGFVERLDSKTGRKRLKMAKGATHLLISGMTGVGKTRRALTPMCVMWGGPAVAVSSKDDLMEYVMERRWGPKGLIDLRPIASPVYPEGLQRFSYDPTTTITTPMEALTVASCIMQMSTVGMGSGIDQVSDSGIWEANAAGPLAAFLWAASGQGNSLGMPWVLKAVDNIGPSPKRSDDDDVIELDPDDDGAGWDEAARLCAEYDVLAIGMKRIKGMGPAQRDSVALNLRKAVVPWLHTSLAEMYDPELRAPTFDPTFLDDPMATLFILVPADGTTAGAAVTLLDSLVRRWREKTSRREPDMRRLLLCVDELPNIAPIPSLRRIIGEGRGLHINLVAAMQASCQMDTVYGRLYADEVRAIFPGVLVMKGAREQELLQAGQDWSPLTTRHPEVYNQGSGERSLSSELGPQMRWQELLPKDREVARLLIRGDVGTIVKIPDWTVVKKYLDDAWKSRVNGETKTASDHVKVLDQIRKLWADAT